jgi:Hemocyanin, ig-like domain/Hemocyanin, copper containing domain
MLAKPRTVAAAPKLFSPPPKGGDERRRISIGGLSPQLDYWREDVLANEHHQHWHEVYPFTGLPPSDFREWLEARTPAELVAILNALQPDPKWANLVPSSTLAQRAQFFNEAAKAAGDEIWNLPRDIYRLIFRLNDRQGELFLYMHEQMLARYDAELLSVGLDRVKPFGPNHWKKEIEAGYDPEEEDEPEPEFGPRPQKAVLPKGAVDWLVDAHSQIADAIAAKQLLGANGNGVPIDRTNLGEAVEATVWQLHQLDGNAYQGLHNQGHMFLSEFSNPRGVMANPVAAIRDQVFWQWHKCIDDLSASWQEKLDPFDFDDAPNVLVRNSTDPDSKAAWASPDIILCRTADLPAGQDPQEVGEELFGGDNWSQDFSEPGGGGGLQPVNQLVTAMESANYGGEAIQFLTHEPFSYFFRVENLSSKQLELTARIFLAPTAQAKDRRAWIEMDKFLLTVAAQSKAVVYQSDTESSVIKRPVDLGPTDIQAPNGATDEGSYCDCGWPYTLLLPRGTPAGIEYRLLVMFTDATIDRVEAPTQCGSMSWCGAVDRYPDTRNMGYPFCRPFGTDPDAIHDTFVELQSAAARTVTIKHA